MWAAELSSHSCQYSELQYDMQRNQRLESRQGYFSPLHRLQVKSWSTQPQIPWILSRGAG